MNWLLKNNAAVCMFYRNKFFKKQTREKGLLVLFRVVKEGVRQPKCRRPKSVA